jgi:hypothetical protein
MKKKLLIAGAVLVVLGLVAAGAGYWIAFSGNTVDYEGERGVKLPRGTGFATLIDSLDSSGILESRQTMNRVLRVRERRVELGHPQQSSPGPPVAGVDHHSAGHAAGEGRRRRCAQHGLQERRLSPGAE